jgi:hypothetical protein
MTEAKVQQLLASSDLPRRLETARTQPAYEAAMRAMPKPPSIVLVIVIVGLLAACAVLPLAGLAVMPTLPPLWAFAILGGLSVLFLALTVSTWRRFHALRHAPVRRELYAVINRDHLRIEATDIYYLTLWAPGTPPFRAQLMRGKPACAVGDVGVALFRGKLLVEIIKVPVEWKRAAS